MDELGPGEVFGHPSLLSGLAPSIDVRAAEDTLCYLIDPSDAARLLSTPPGLRFLAQSLRRRTVRALEGAEGTRADPWRAHVGTLVRRPPITGEPGETVAGAAERMARERISSLLIPLPDGTLGIVTDRDLRSRVIAAGRSGDTPLREVMTAPAFTVASDAPLAEVLTVMLERGVHHLPVVEGTAVVGIVTDTDLLGLERSTPFHLKSSIERARTRDEAVRAGGWIPRAVRAAVDAGVDPIDVGHMVAVSIDALTRRLIDLAVEERGEPPGPWAWLALGSEARHEQALATDQDHALAFDPLDAPAERVDRYFGDVAESVTAGLEAAGIPRCRAKVIAANPGWRGTVGQWAERFRSWIEDAGPEGSALTAIAFDHRRVHGALPIETTLEGIVRSSPRHPIFLRHIARNAIADRPPTGFFRDFVVDAGGDHAGTLDVKHGGITAITSLARAYALSVGSTEIRTLRRLHIAATAGRIEEDDAAALADSFRLLWQIRLEHQSAAVAEGRDPDDLVDPRALRPITRSGLKEAFRAIDRAQRALAVEHGLRVR